MESKLEIREVEIPSPIEYLKIGDDFFYKGQYISGYEEGYSKIKRFYKEVLYWGGVKEKIKKDSYGCSVWMELENEKVILLGSLNYKNKFCEKMKL